MQLYLLNLTKRAKFAGSVGHPMTKMFQLQGASPSCPWTPLGALLPDPQYRLGLRTCHGAPQPLTPSAAYDCPTELCPGTSNRKSAPMSIAYVALVKIWKRDTKVFPSTSRCLYTCGVSMPCRPKVCMLVFFTLRLIQVVQDG